VHWDEPRYRLPRSAASRSRVVSLLSSASALPVIERGSTTSSIASTRHDLDGLLAGRKRKHIRDRVTAIFPFPFAAQFPAPRWTSAVDGSGEQMLGYHPEHVGRFVPSKKATGPGDDQTRCEGFAKCGASSAKNSLVVNRALAVFDRARKTRRTMLDCSKHLLHARSGRGLRSNLRGGWGACEKRKGN